MAKAVEPRRVQKPLILALLILAALGLIVVQLRSPEQVSTAGRWTVAVFAPLFHAGTWSSERVRGVLSWALSSQAAQLSNRQLRRENAELKARVSLLRERIAKLERERELRTSPLPELGLVCRYANVVALSSQRWVHSIVVDQGKIDGVRAAMPVIDYSGALVGKVVDAGANSAIVQLLIDPNFGIGAMIADNSSRVRGLASGLGEAKRLRFRPNEQQKQMQVGMEVVSSGFEGSVYPKGLRLGVITQVTSDKYSMQYADVEPAANFESLEEVILIDTEPMSAAAASRPAAPLTPRPAGPLALGDESSIVLRPPAAPEDRGFEIERFDATAEEPPESPMERPGFEAPSLGQETTEPFRTPAAPSGHRPDSPTP